MSRAQRQSIQKTTILEENELDLLYGFKDTTALEDKKGLTVFPLNSSLTVLGESCFAPFLSSRYKGLSLASVERNAACDYKVYFYDTTSREALHFTGCFVSYEVVQAAKRKVLARLENPPSP